MAAPYLRLGVNIDHVATLRNARDQGYPDPVRAAHMAIMAGADSITAHLREDRRHIRDGDIELLKRQILTPLNFEIAATDEMVAFASRIRPHAACLVPEKRSERTTEGGLDIVGGHNHLAPVVRHLVGEGIRVSLFVEPETEVMEAARGLGAPVVELHSGAYCEAVSCRRRGIGPARARAAEDGGRARRGARARDPCRPRPHLRHRAHRRRDPAGGRAQHRPFPDLRGGVHGPRRGRAGDAPGDGRGQGGALILGIGSDLCDIRRIGRSIERFGERFTGRIFTEGERRRSDRRAARAESYARRFAAKEACAKALGTGMRRGVFWRDMEVVNLPGGRPTMRADRRRARAPRCHHSARM